jgi:hypothetical protein
LASLRVVRGLGSESVKVDRTLVIPLLRGLTRTLGIPW